VEQAVIDRMLKDAGDRRSAAVVVWGPAGIGKTALLEHTAEAADGFCVLRATGIELEAELPFAGLHMLLGPVLDRIDALPPPQRAALRGAFGMASVSSGDRFLVGLAVLTLLSEVAEQTPLLCLVDDAQWLDRASAETLVFVARRLAGEGVALVLAMRDGDSTRLFAGIPELRLAGLDRASAEALLAEWCPDLAPMVRERVLTETEGNPLGLMELPAALTPAQRAGEGLPPSYSGGALPLTMRMQVSFGVQAARLSESAAMLLLVAAIEESGDLDVVLRASGRLRAGHADLEEVERSRLVEVVGTTVQFRHPLVRAAVLQSAPVARRITAHRALAAVLSELDAEDRAAWHLAAACTGPDEVIAARLEETAVRSGAREGYAAQAAALERAAELTLGGVAWARRLTAAAEAACAAGEFPRALAIGDRSVGRPIRC
jgi:hypothetical protein